MTDEPTTDTVTLVIRYGGQIGNLRDLLAIHEAAEYEYEGVVCVVARPATDDEREETNP